MKVEQRQTIENWKRGQTLWVIINSSLVQWKLSSRCSVWLGVFRTIRINVVHVEPFTPCHNCIFAMCGTKGISCEQAQHNVWLYPVPCHNYQLVCSFVAKVGMVRAKRIVVMVLVTPGSSDNCRYLPLCVHNIPSEQNRWPDVWCHGPL